VQSQRITADGSVCVVPTPGHTPGHVSVIVRAHGIHYFLCGDAAYTEAALLDEAVDGVSLDEAVSRRTLRTIGAFVRDTPTVFLPSHDPQSVERLQSRTLTHMEARA
jgi:glyoxylase-like metal-dependent hydrolase (beta-lactamase superfamily II)